MTQRPDPRRRAGDRCRRGGGVGDRRRRRTDECLPAPDESPVEVGTAAPIVIRHRHRRRRRHRHRRHRRRRARRPRRSTRTTSPTPSRSTRPSTARSRRRRTPTTGPPTSSPAPVAGRRCSRRSPGSSTRCQANTWDPDVGDPATRGGNAVSIIGDDGVRYYLAHFQLIDPAIMPGARVVGRRLPRRDGRHRAGERVPRPLRAVAAVPEPGVVGAPRRDLAGRVPDVVARRREPLAARRAAGVVRRVSRRLHRSRRRPIPSARAVRRLVGDDSIELLELTLALGELELGLHLGDRLWSRCGT